MSILQFIPPEEIKRLNSALKDKTTHLSIMADVFRFNTLYSIMNAGSGHIGSSFSFMDIITYLWLDEMQSANEPGNPDADLFFSSKGHDAPGLYALLTGLGKLEFDLIHKLRRKDGLPGHPDVSIPYLITNTGSLGMGISKAKGMAIAKRLNGNQGRIFVIMGDGELQEGQVWESLQPAANGKFAEINVIIDHNKIQSDTWVDSVSDLGDLEQRFRSHGWEVARCDGNSVEALKESFNHFATVTDKPKVLIADTIKGKGVSFMETLGSSGDDAYYKFHSGAPSFDNYQSASIEILSRINEKLEEENAEKVKTQEIGHIMPVPPSNPERLVSAYGEELVKLAEEDEDIVALDADLVLDTGLIPFKNQFPERFIECGIAEQDMVSAAGGLALMGKVPVVHSFACFLSTRPNEHIYNNATEHTKIIYAGSLAGLLPSGPGHSHQSVRDISLLSSIPGMTLIQPCNEQESRLAIRWAVKENSHSTYIRLVSIPCETPFTLPENYQLEHGKGIALTEGDDVIIVAYGPVMLNEAVHAANILKKKHDLHVKVINFPWLNYIDSQWLVEHIQSCKFVCVIDDHYTKSGLGEYFASELLVNGLGNKNIKLLGLDEIPRCGKNNEVLVSHNLDRESIIRKIIEQV